MVTETIQMREYADGTIITEDEFDEYDNALPYYDDYRQFESTIDQIESFTGE